MGIMRKRIFCILPILSCFAAAPAVANWQYPGTYVGDGVYTDDGSRFVISARGGASISYAKIQNDVGALAAYYYMNDAGTVIPEFVCGGPDGCDSLGLQYLGYGDIGDLSAADNYSDFSFAAGASIGWTIPNRPQWRVELGWDHISESEYNASPLFEGDLTLSEGSTEFIQSGGAQSKIDTDIISVMAFYDFFDGLQKPVQTVIPYVGFGIGYADVKTTLNLSDLYGDLSMAADLRKFGELDDNGILQFYKSEHDNSSIAGLLAVGMSYGITDQMFLDFGARLAYVPRVKWVIADEGENHTRDWFSAKNLIYANIMLGLRFEF